MEPSRETSPPRPFPDSFTPELNLPAFEAYRSEGLSLAPTIKTGIRYIEKWFRKKYSAPVEEKPYFDNQRLLMRAIAAEPPPQSGQSTRLGLVGDLMWLRDGWDSFLSDE